MSFTSGELRDFIGAVRGSDTSTDTVVTGTVARVDPDGTAWVQIGQNPEPTPCARDMACHAGDEVTVRIADHKATVTGNASAPATDDKKANVAYNFAGVANETATVAQSTANQAQKVAANAATKADVAEIAAQEAARVASAVNQHFWDDERGAHVTEEAKDDYLVEPNGFQNLMTSIGNIFTKAVSGVEKILRSDTASGMVVYDGECAPNATDLADHAVAAFTADGVQIGKNSDAHIKMDFNSFRIVDRNGTGFFDVNDMRDESGYATLNERFNSVSTFTVAATVSEVIFVMVGGAAAEYTRSGKTFTLTNPPSTPSYAVDVRYTTTDKAQYYTLGERSPDPSSRIGIRSVAEGMHNTASGSYSHAEGHNNYATGYASHAEGNSLAIASGKGSHAEGTNSDATGDYSHAEGSNTNASGYASHAEGGDDAAHYSSDGNVASGDFSHAEGHVTLASGLASHAEGGTDNNLHPVTASGDYSHAEGFQTEASGTASHAEGSNTIAASTNQHVQGRWNRKDDSNTYAHIIGDGASRDYRSNLHTVAWDGTAWYKNNGNVICSDGTNIRCDGQTIGSADNLSYVLQFPLFKIQELSVTTTAQSGGQFSASVNIPAISGFRPIGCIGMSNSHGTQFACSYWDIVAKSSSPSGYEFNVYGGHTKSGAATDVLFILDILYVRTNLVG